MPSKYVLNSGPSLYKQRADKFHKIVKSITIEIIKTDSIAGQKILGTFLAIPKDSGFVSYILNSSFKSSTSVKDMKSISDNKSNKVQNEVRLTNEEDENEDTD